MYVLVWMIAWSGFKSCWVTIKLRLPLLISMIPNSVWLSTSALSRGKYGVKLNVTCKCYEGLIGAEICK